MFVVAFPSKQMETHLKFLPNADTLSMAVVNERNCSMGFAFEWCSFEDGDVSQDEMSVV